MFRCFRMWLRIVLPADVTVVLLLGLIGFIVVFCAIRDQFGDPTAWESYRAAIQMIVWVATATYASFRVAYFHPVENRPYGMWLAATPWRHPQALPLGPIHLVWQDALIVLSLMALFPAEEFSRLTIPMLFLLVYCLSQAFSHCRVGVYWTSCSLAFLFGCLILAASAPWLRLLIAGLMYPVAYVGTYDLLRAFPFTKEERERLRLAHANEPASWTLTTAGLPLSPAKIYHGSWSISRTNALLIATTISWLLFSLAFNFRDLQPEFDARMNVALSNIVAIAIVARVSIYVLGFAPPISLVGRVATGRFIIPEYDVVFFAPIVVAIGAWVLSIVAAKLGIATIISVPAIAGLAVWLSLVLPPRRVNWMYTGHHRIAYRFRAAALQHVTGTKQSK